MDKELIEIQKKDFLALENQCLPFCKNLLLLSLVGFLLNCIPIYYYGASEEAVSLVGLLFTHLGIIATTALGVDCANRLFHNLVGYSGSRKFAFGLAMKQLLNMSLLMFVTTCAVLGFENLLFGFWVATIPDLVINEFTSSMFWYVLLILPSGFFGAVMSALYQKHGNLAIVAFIQISIFIVWLFPSEILLTPVICYLILVFCLGYKAIMTVDVKDLR